MARPTTRKVTMHTRTLMATAALGLFTLAAQATDLMQVWQAARQNDPQGVALEAGRQVGAARREQAASLWRPQVGLSASVGLSSAETRTKGAEFAAPVFPLPVRDAAFNTSVDGGTATRWALQARQPLYAPERQAQRRQLEVAAEATDLEWQAGQQDWMLQVVQRYFELGLAARKLALLQQQQVAVEKALSEAKDRFDLGDAPITDTHEAAARARALQAQVVAATHEVEVARHTLADGTGLAAAQLSPRLPTGKTVTQPLEPLNHWIELARQNNPMVRLLQAQARGAQAESQKHTAAAATTVDLVAQASSERLSGSGDFGSASNRQSQQMVGVMLNLPLYTGGWRQAKLEESLRLEDKARAEIDKARLQAGQWTRAAWLGLQSGEARLDALDKARVASQARLDATRLGRQVGDRTTLELLNAENDAATAELALVQARVELVLHRMRLDALAGQLGEPRLQAIDAALQP
jgi:outer membrane protein